MWVTGSYDTDTNQVLWGTGNPVPMYNAYYRPGDNLYTNSLISWDADTGKMNWYHQYVPGDMWDYDAAGTHILIDGQIGGQPHKLVTHSQRNGFLYSFERANGQTLLATPYQETISWTKGIDQKTGLPLDYDPMLSKLVAFGETREQAIDRMLRALEEYVIGGIKTNIGLFRRILMDEGFRAARIDTGYLERLLAEPDAPVPPPEATG